MCIPLKMNDGRGKSRHLVLEAPAMHGSTRWRVAIVNYKMYDIVRARFVSILSDPKPRLYHWVRLCLYSVHDSHFLFNGNWFPLPHALSHLYLNLISGNTAVSKPHLQPISLRFDVLSALWYPALYGHGLVINTFPETNCFLRKAISVFHSFELFEKVICSSHTILVLSVDLLAYLCQ